MIQITILLAAWSVSSKKLDLIGRCHKMFTRYLILQFGVPVHETQAMQPSKNLEDLFGQKVCSSRYLILPSPSDFSSTCLP